MGWWRMRTGTSGSRKWKGYIGKLDPKSGEVTAYQMPDEKAEDPHTAVFDARGILWFTVQVGSMVGRLDPRTGKIDLKAVQGQRPLPYGIAINSKGVPFFCEFGTNKWPKSIRRPWRLRSSSSGRRAAAPHAIDAEDRIYFTDYEGGNLGRLDPATGAVKMWPSPSGKGAAPYGITITPDGAVWFSESGMKQTRWCALIPKWSSSRSPRFLGGGTVRNMVATPDGRVYIACSGVNKVGVVQPSR